MNKKVKLLTTSLLVVGALTACNTDRDTAMDPSYRQPVNYDRVSYNGNYQNNNGFTPRPGNVTDRYTDLDRNRVTDRNPDLDMDFVTNRNERTDNNGNVRYSKINRDIHNNRNDVGYNYYNDRNFHGHIDNNHPTRNVTMNGSYMNSDGATAEKITNRVKNMKGVDRVSAVVYGDNVLIAVKPENGTSERTLKSDVRRAVKSYARGRDVNVTVTDNMYNRVNNMSTRLRNGTVTNEMNKDLDDLFRSMRTDYNRITD